MATKKVFICFDYDHDRNYRYLLRAVKENPRSGIKFDDLTPEEIQSDDISRIKAVLTGKIRGATRTLVIVDAHANSYHKDRTEIGERNWQWWEIKKSLTEGNRLIGVKIKSDYNAPEPMKGQGVRWANSFKVESILDAIEDS